MHGLHQNERLSTETTKSWDGMFFVGQQILNFLKSPMQENSKPERMKKNEKKILLINQPNYRPTFGLTDWPTDAV